MTLYDPYVWACGWVADGSDASFFFKSQMASV